jgi:2-polyprenyl-3-methyl-5-hydroxy-6-metoxy-1,4-benzoquinol methylase
MHYADEYAGVDQKHWWFLGREARIVTTLRRYAPLGSRLLDVGCGTGGLSAELARWYSVEGVDPSPQAVAVARSRGVMAQVVEPGSELPGGFDVACAFDVLEHVEDDVKLARQLARAVRPGGVVMATVPAYGWLWGPMDELGGHRRRYRLHELLRVMLAAGLRRVYATYFNSVLFPAIALGRLAGFPRRDHELEPPPPALNRLLRTVFVSESRITGRLSLPWGASILFLGISDNSA